MAKKDHRWVNGYPSYTQLMRQTFPWKTAQMRGKEKPTAEILPPRSGYKWPFCKYLVQRVMVGRAFPCSNYVKLFGITYRNTDLSDMGICFCFLLIPLV